MTNWFRKFAHSVSTWVGSPAAFAICILIVVVWAMVGPLFNFSDTWQLFINTGTTIVTFLMVFLIQNTQNRDSRAFHLKLDELIRSSKHARNQMIDVETLSDEELDQLHAELTDLRDTTENRLDEVKHHKTKRSGHPANHHPTNHKNSKS